MRNILLLFALLLFSTPAFAAAKVQEITGQNGLKAWLIEDHNLPIVTVKIDFSGAGSAYDPQGKEGLSDLAVRLLDEGAGDMNSLALNRALEQYAIRFSADASEDSADVTLETLSEFKGDGFALLALMLSKPRFDADAVERVRADLISWLKEVEENPIYAASLAWKTLAFPGHPYHQPKLGTLSSLPRITREDLQQYASHMACSKKIIAIVGDITPAEAASLLETLFPSYKCSTAAMAIANVNVADGSGSSVKIRKSVPQTVVQASLPGVLREDPRYYALVVLNQIFGGGTLTARLGNEIRIKRGLAYIAESDIAQNEHSAYISIHFATRAEQADSAVNVFQSEVKKMAEKGVTQAELDDAKHYLTGSFPLNLDNEGALAGYLIEMQRHNLGIDYLEKRNDKINAVTLGEVNALAKEIFSHKPLIVMVGE
jgi:zinc protease